jgi:hypothetical protein
MNLYVKQFQGIIKGINTASGHKQIPQETQE